MTNGPDEQQPGQEPPPPPPPPSGGGRGLFARNDPDQPGPPPPPRAQQPPREDPRSQLLPPQDPGDNPFLLPNERGGGPIYGAPPLPVIPLALMLLAIVVGGALFYLSMEDKEKTGITPQQAASSLVLHLDGVDITEDAFRREIGTGITKGRVPCDKLAGQPADNIAAGLRLGALKMEVPNTSGVAAKSGQKADDASLLVAAKVVLDACPKGAVPQQQQPPANPPGGQQQPPGGSQPAPGGQQPAPTATRAPAPGGQPPAPAGTQPPAPAGTPRPTTPAAPAAPGR